MQNHIEGVSRLLAFVLIAASALVAVSTAASWQAPKERITVIATMPSGRG